MILGLILLTTDISMIFAIIMYAVGYYSGNKFTSPKKKKVRKIKIEKTKLFFRKYSDYSIFFGRLIPFTRTYVSLIAGMCKKEFLSYLFYSFFGIFIWNAIFVSLGFSLFINLEVIGKFYHDYKILILIAFSASIVGMLGSFIRNKKRWKNEKDC